MILLVVIIVFFILKSFDLVYLFQIKEYRIDRILGFLREENILNILYLRKIRMPALSLRNVLIGQGIFFNILPLYLLLRDLSSAYLLIVLLLTPILAFLAMLLGLLLSEIPVQIYRRLVIFLAAEKVKRSKAVFIGITGSYGKTSTKEFLYQILSQKFKTEKTQQNYNSDIGVAISILRNLKSDTQYFIAELGAYRIGEIRSICDFIHPKYGVLTAIGNQHLNLFGSKKNLIEAKSELLEALPATGTAYINKDIKDWQYISTKTRAKKVYFSLANPPFEIKTSLLGKHHLQNLLPCIALALDLGLKKDEIIETLRHLKPLKSRLSKEHGINGSTILNDSYSSNVEGFIAAINTAKEMDFSQKLILSRGLIELGSEKTSSYQKIIEAINKSDLKLLTIDELFKRLDRENKVVAFQAESNLLDYVRNKADKNTLIVIEGRFEPKLITSLIQR